MFIRKLKTKTGTYLVKVHNMWKDGKVIQKHICVIGKEINGKKVLYGQIQDSKITDISIAGNVLILKEIANQLELQKILDSHTDEHGKWILALVLAHCTTPTSINKMKNWCKKYGAHDLINLHSDECKKDRFYGALDYLDEKTMLRIEKELFESIREIVMKENDSFFYDITNVYFCGSRCRIAKSGYNPNKLGLPQIHIGLAITREFGFPIFHQVFEGNIQDARSIDQVLRTLKDFGIKKCTLIWDRGITSKKSIFKAKKLGFEVIVGLPLRGKLKDKAIRIRKNIHNIDNRVRLSTQILYSKGFLSNVYGHGGKLVICSNEKEKNMLKEIRYDEIEEALCRQKRKLKIKDCIKKFLNGSSINKETLAKAESTDGLYALFSTNSSLTDKEIVKIYFEKDKIEKAFKCLKGMIGMRPVRHWLSDRVKAHVFICYLSYALLALLEWKLKTANIEMSASSSLELLENLYRVKIMDPKTGNMFLKHSVMSKEQEKIFKAVNKSLVKNIV